MTKHTPSKSLSALPVTTQLTALPTALPTTPIALQPQATTTLPTDPDLQSKAQALNHRTKNLNNAELNLATHQSDLEARQSQIDTLWSTLQTASDALLRRELAQTNREQTFNEQAHHRTLHLNASTLTLNNLKEALDLRWKFICQCEATLEERKSVLATRESGVEEREGAVFAWEEGVRKRERDVDDRAGHVVRERREVEESVKEVVEREKELEECGKRRGEQGVYWGEKWAALHDMRQGVVNVFDAEMKRARQFVGDYDLWDVYGEYIGTFEEAGEKHLEPMLSGKASVGEGAVAQVQLEMLTTEVREWLGSLERMLEEKWD
ncbi:hypothetical protein PRZ48_012118 [Zasmidium cellare]|uniref:Uncharacterized protein n=1 Tax=Zasmidium cellare TaxID=395010 RepID=A0ABR0E487_ZASCE|nr:hypothetical protein PRZ48_012118 [Zasmidium cellare]